MHRSVIYAILIICVSLIAYSNTLHAPFVFDDFSKIVDNPLLKDVHNFLDSNTLNNHRYLGYLTFALNHHVHDLTVTGYHIVNIMIHVINGLLVYVLVLLTFRAPHFRTASRYLLKVKWHIALFTALFFVSHPLQTQAVTYIVQRFTSLAVLFYLLALVLYIHMRLTESRAWRIALYTLSLLSVIFAMKTKEIAFTLPLVITLYEALFFQGKSQKRVLMLIPYLLTMLIIPLGLIEIERPLGDIIGNVSEMTKVHTELSRFVYLMTEFRVILTYLRLVFVPTNQNFDYDYPIYPVFSDPNVFLSFLFLFIVLIAALFLLYRSRTANYQAIGEQNTTSATAHNLRLISFGILWFFITLSVESSVIPIVDVMFEHRMYLPMVGVSLAVIALLFTLRKAFRERRKMIDKVVFVGLVLIITALSYATYSRNSIWQDEILFWEDVARKSPRKARVFNELGIAYANGGLFDDAIQAHMKAVRLMPKNAQFRNNLGVALESKGDNNKAARQYHLAIKLNPDYAEAYYNLGNVYRETNYVNKAIKQYRNAIKLKPDFYYAYVNLGIAYESKGMNEEAIRTFRTALMFNPGFALPHYRIGQIYLKRGQLPQAKREFERVLNIDPHFEDVKALLLRMSQR